MNTAAVPITHKDDHLLGSGVLIAPRLVLTCRHVVDEYFAGAWQRGYSEQDVFAGDTPCAAILRSPPEDAPPEDDGHLDLALLRLQNDSPGLVVPIVAGPVAASLYDQAELIGFHERPAPLRYGRTEVRLPVRMSGLIDTDVVDFASALVRRGMSGAPLLLEYHSQPVCLGVARLGGLGRAASVITTGSAIRPFIEGLEEPWRSWASAVLFRALLREELEQYFEDVEADAATLPSFYPAALQRSHDQGMAFDRIRQRARVLERQTFDKWRAEQADRELRRAAADVAAFDVRQYDPWRSRSETRSLAEEPEASRQVDSFFWDERADSAQFRQVVILGDPGFGKTWVLRHEARRLARRCREILTASGRFEAPSDLLIPVRARLPDLARLDATTLVERLRRRFEEQQLPATLSEQLLGLAERGSLVLLLDAWDEIVADSEPLRYHVEVFARTTNSRIVFTSRGARYGRSPIPGAPELEILAFERREIEAFARVWFGNADELADAFLRVLDQHAAINGLGRIPLLLALLCRVFQAEPRTLPVRRGALYEQCLWGLLRDWKKADHKRNVPDDMIRGRIAEVARAAAHLFPDEQFSTQALAEAAGYHLDSQPNREAAQAFVDQLKNDGLLIPTAHHATGWSWLHRTLYEWLVAHAVASRAPRAGFRALGKWIDERTSDPLWREVIVLMAGELPNPAALLKHLAKGNDDMFRPRLALAVRCQPEIAPEARATPAVQREIDAITTTAMNAFVGWAVRNIHAAAPVLKESLPSLPLINGRWGKEHLLTRLSQELAGSDSTEFFRAAFCARHLGVAAASEPILHALVSRLTDENLYLRAEAEQVLRTLGAAAATPFVRDRLRALLVNPDNGVRETAAAVIDSLELAAASPAVVEALLACLEDPLAPVRVAALSALSWVAPEAVPQHLADTLIRLILDEPVEIPDMVLRDEAGRVLEAICTTAVPRAVFDWYTARLTDPAPAVRLDVAHVISHVGASGVSDPVLDAMVASLTHADTTVRVQAIVTLGQLGPAAAAERVRRALAGCLGDPKREVRLPAATALGRLGSGPADRVITAALIDALTDEEIEVRRNSADALGELERAATSGTVDALVTCLARDEAWKVRKAAAEALGRFGPRIASEPLVAALLGSLRDKDANVRGAAAGTLAALGPSVASPSVLGELLERIFHDDSEGVARDAVTALGDFGPAATDRVLSSFLKLMKKYPDDYTRRLVAQAVGRLGPAAATPSILRALVEQVTNGTERECATAAEALVQLAPAADPEPVMHALIDLLKNRTEHVRRAAATAVGGLQRRGFRVKSIRRVAAKHTPRTTRRGGQKSKGRR